MWPGPLDENGNPPQDCAVYDQIYEIYLRDIVQYEETGFINENLENWPWQLGAPVVDGDGIPDNYDLAAGDRPQILGHQTAWWVMNDRGNTHETTKTEPLGIEIQVSAFSASSSNEHINNATLYQYKIIYKGNAPLEDAYFGIFQDVDLGNFSDDYVGSDSTLGMGYAYNGDNLDEGTTGYGDAPPAVGFDILQGPLVDSDGLDNNQNGQIDEPGERLSMTSFGFFDSGLRGDPESGPDYYNLMQGKWTDGQPFTVGGDGRNFSNIPTTFFFSGDPVTRQGWTENNPDPIGSLAPPLPPADRRSAVSSGPFEMQPGDVQEITFAVVWARGADNLDSVSKLRDASIEVQAAFDAGFEIELPDSAPLGAVSLAAPDNGVSQQPLDAFLQWQALPQPTAFEVQWDVDAGFPAPFSEEAAGSSTFRLSGLLPNQQYYWRVRAVNAGEYGPWSDTWNFTTSDVTLGSGIINIQGFMTTQNAAGPIDPPDMAAFAFDDLGFPILEGSLTPEGSYPDPGRPTSGVEQSSNGSVWGIHTGGPSRRLFENDNGQSFLERTIFNRGNAEIFGTHDYEWRFTQQCLDTMDGTIAEGDCLAWKAFSDGSTIEVPFELWNIRNPADETDDYRMIPIICEELCGAGTTDGVFDIGGDHESSPDLDDPYTDWVYWYNVDSDMPSVGEEDYVDYFFGSAQPGEEALGRTVLVQLDGGTAAPYDVALPEPGTTFRIASGPLSAPILSSPLNNGIQQSTTTSMYWNAIPSIYHIQIDRTPDFESPIINFDFIEQPFFQTEDLPGNTSYFWRVRMIGSMGQPISAWSETWQFTIPVNVGTDLPEAPLTFSLEQSYPNPFNNNTTIRYAVAENTEVLVEVFDTLGRRVSTLVNETQPAGWHEVSFSASNLPSGMYFYRIKASHFTETKTMVVMR